MCFSTFFFFCTNLFEKSCIKIEKWGNDKVESVFETSGTVLIVHLPVDLDHPVSDDIRRESDRIIGRQYIKNMVFDFSETAFMDSSGIGLLMGRYRALGMRRKCVQVIQKASETFRNRQIHRHLRGGKNISRTGGRILWKTQMK